MYKEGDLIKPKEHTISTDSIYVYNIEKLEVIYVSSYYIECKVLETNENWTKYRSNHSYKCKGQTIYIYTRAYKRFEFVNNSPKESIWF